MNIILNNQPSIYSDIFPLYLTPKQCIKYYSSNKRLYNIYLNNNKFEDYYFTPKDRNELLYAIDKWCNKKEEAILEYGHISYWNTSYIINMANLFSSFEDFNDNINEWNTSNVNDMSNMFYDVDNFNQPLENWNTSNVNDMSYMFYGAHNFNQPIENWNTSNVNDMSYMFYEAAIFNQPI
ncbi:MAG: BspA family leucine-rich repeat surface protein [Patescibacteria group bacterium]